MPKHPFAKALHFEYEDSYLPKALLATDDVTYDSEFLNAEATFSQWDEFRATSSVSGWGKTYNTQKMLLALAGKTGNFHVTFRRTRCSCGVRDVARSFGHLDPKTGEIVKVFVVVEAIQESFGFSSRLMNPRWICIDCGDLGGAQADEKLRFEQIEHVCPSLKEHEVPASYPRRKNSST